jgi:protocatechuate 3,4-dioxygenase beta subunit
MELKQRLGLLFATAGLFFAARGEPIQPLDLKPHAGLSLFDSSRVEWLLPRGAQSFGGVPFQIDGALLLYGSNGSQKSRPARTNIEPIAVGRPFQALHLLAGAQTSIKDGTAIASIRLEYANGSNAVLAVNYGEQVRDWYGPAHKAEPAPTQAREVWQAQSSASAARDCYLRLFLSVLTNPAPELEVKSISLESAKKSAALMVVGMCVGPAAVEGAAATNFFPDLQPRSGERFALGGVVRNTNGMGLAGARVLVVNARALNTTSFGEAPEGFGIGTEARTDDHGRFSLPGLPDNRLYRLLVDAAGFETVFYEGADPKAPPVEVRLSTPLTNTPPKYSVRARLVDANGKPVSGATVSLEGVGTGTSTSWGGSHGFPDEVFSDGKGEIAAGRDLEFSRLQVRIHSPGLAPKMVWLPVSNAPALVQLEVGARLQGRVIKDGKPLSGIRVGVSGAERSSEVFAGHYEATTDADGVFCFPHLPSSVSWNFYGIMNSLSAHGALPMQVLKTGDTGETNDLGDLAVQPGFRLAGKLQTRHGEPLPKGIKVRLGYESGWDSASATADTNGVFRFKGLAKGEITLSLDSRSWSLSGNNRSLDQWNPWELVGLIEGDKEDLVIGIQPGERRYNGSASGNGQLPTQDQPRGRPISGTEPSGPPPILVAGRVVDAKTGQTVSNFQVIPGYQPPVTSAAAPSRPLLQTLLGGRNKKTVPWNELPFWQYNAAEQMTNGVFSLEFPRLTSTPMVRIEAKGYQPLETDPIPTNAQELVLRLQTGEGPNGVVLLPDGTPAEGATVFYAAKREQCSLTDRAIQAYGRKEGILTTGKDGKFSFDARSGGARIFISHPQGWADVPVSEAAGTRIKLELWASLKGVLLYTNGSPASNVTLALTRQHDWQGGEPIANLQGKVETDSQGRFEFAGVPTGRLQVERVIPFGNNGWTYQTQTWLYVKPGVTNDLGNVTYDQPPPLPALEQIKQRLGL